MLMTPDVGVISACSLTAPVDSSSDDDDITRTDVTITPGDISIVEATPNANSLNSLDRSCSPFDATSDADATEASSPELVPNASVPSKQDDCDAQATEDAVGASMSSFSEENATFDLNESLPRKGEAGVVAEDVKSNDVKLKGLFNNCLLIYPLMKMTYAVIFNLISLFIVLIVSMTSNVMIHFLVSLVNKPFMNRFTPDTVQKKLLHV